MDTHKYEKLKKVLETVPAGFLVDSGWLTTHNINRFHTRGYIKSGWLERVVRGVFRRPAPSTNPIDWRTCLLSVQHIMNHRVHVGGTTALALQGYSHYLPLGGNMSVWLYGQKVPSWLNKLPLDAKIITRKVSLFDDPTLGLAKETATQEDNHPWDWPLIMSSPERAIFEALDELPDEESFHNLDMQFEGLTSLRPRLLADLLTGCQKIKVRRLFFVLADRHGHAWRKRLDPEAFNLGTGDRALVKGGKLHPLYRVMVPPEFATPIQETAHGS
tara:strand:- start:5634 stop:6452 length:819 start_codon:yes stop_codon:yes gene_type:complete